MENRENISRGVKRNPIITLPGQVSASPRALGKVSIFKVFLRVVNSKKSQMGRKNRNPHLNFKFLNEKLSNLEGTALPRVTILKYVLKMYLVLAT